MVMPPSAAINANPSFSNPIPQTTQKETPLKTIKDKASNLLQSVTSHFHHKEVSFGKLIHDATMGDAFCPHDSCKG
jgi:hypothetical protein